MIQGALFREYLNPIRLKSGQDKCPCCGKVMRAYCKTLDKRLVDLLREIAIKLGSDRDIFNPKWIWENDVAAHNKITDFQKLGYWKLIKKTKKAGRWHITQKGKSFLGGKITLPSRVWVFNNKVVLEEDSRIQVNNADERWQTIRSDYTLDYVPQGYRTELDYQNLLIN